MRTERTIGTKEHLIKTFEKARHFAVRLVPDLAFVANLPAHIVAAEAMAAGEEPAVSTIVQTLSGVIRKGCASPEQLANAVDLKFETRPNPCQTFTTVVHLIPPGDPYEDFEDVPTWVRYAHDLATFDDLYRGT